MGDRRPFSFRFWSSGPSSAPRRNSTTQVTTRSPPATTTPSPIAPPKPEPRSDSQSTANNTIATSTNPPAAEGENPTSQSTTTTTTTATQPTPPSSEVPTAEPTTNATTAASSTPPIVETQTPVGQSTTITSPPASTPPSTTPPSGEVQTSSQPTPNALSHPTSEPEPETSSPSRATTRSPSSSKPASPSRRTTQSRPPSQPSSLSRATPQARSTPSSPSRVGSRTPSTPQKVSQPRSPPRLPSNSPKQTSPTSKKATQPNSPSNESLSTIQEISNGDEAPPALASKEKETKIATSQQEGLEPQPKEDVKSNSAANHFNSTQNIEPTINHGDKPVVDSNAKPEKTKEVKEVVKVANNEAHKETHKEVNGFLTPSSSSIANKPDKMHKENHEAFNTKDVSINAKPNSQKKSDPPSKENVPLHKDIRGDISRFVNKMAIGDPKRAIHDNPVSVITLAGENRGALMEMGSNSSNRDRTVHIHRGYKINPDERAQATTDEETSSKAKKSQHVKDTNDQPTEAYVNNNSQGVNNSIVFDSSVSERNPGVHMVVNHVHKEPNESIDRARGVEARRAEFNISRAEKFTYEPNVRRRCLEGLFLETSDSETGNPEKPRRHGCRVGCNDKGKKKDIDVL